MRFRDSLLFGIIIGWVAGFFIGMWIYHNAILPETIDNRALELGIMQYNSKVDDFVPKQEFEFDECDLYYLKYGTMKGWKIE